MQRIDRYVVLRDVGLELVEAPVGERVDLDERVLGVPCGKRNRRDRSAD